MAQVVRMPRRRSAAEELHAASAKAFRQIRKAELWRLVLVYGGMASLFALGMLVQYLFTH
jgi:hypothetical protein